LKLYENGVWWIFRNHQLNHKTQFVLCSDFAECRHAALQRLEESALEEMGSSKHVNLVGKESAYYQELSGNYLSMSG